MVQGETTAVLVVGENLLPADMVGKMSCGRTLHFCCAGGQSALFLVLLGVPSLKGLGSAESAVSGSNTSKCTICGVLLLPILLGRFIKWN